MKPKQLHALYSQMNSAEKWLEGHMFCFPGSAVTLVDNDFANSDYNVIYVRLDF